MFAGVSDVSVLSAEKVAPSERCWLEGTVQKISNCANHEYKEHHETLKGNFTVFSKRHSGVNTRVI